MIILSSMKWRKKGLIFNPTEHKLPGNCKEYAQSPQAVVFDDFVRIYFSTRERDNIGKYLSHVSFVDYDLSFSKILGVSNKVVIELGDLGCFDEHGIFPFSVYKDVDIILAYTTGWNRKVSVSADASIGLAISTNGGLNFQKYGKGPILTSSLHEPFLVGDGFVLKINSTYHMWYIFGTEWVNFNESDEPERVYKIAHATSVDRINWIREGRKIISDKINDYECQALPTVVEHNGIYHMFFCFRNAQGFRTDREKSYRIGYAYSTDLVNWTRDDERGAPQTTLGSWDSDMMCYPFVFKCNGNIYLLYNGNEFGRYGFGIAELEGN